MDDHLTADQHRRLAEGLHRQAEYYEEAAHEFGVSMEGHMEQARQCREQAYFHEDAANRIEQKRRNE